ncbi:hypothetical protein D3C81_1512870 [compost metagenome]
MTRHSKIAVFRSPNLSRPASPLCHSEKSTSIQLTSSLRNRLLSLASTWLVCIALVASRLCSPNRISFCSVSDNSDVFRTKSGSKPIPPPLPLLAYTGIPAPLNASISRYIVRLDTSKRSASSAAVIVLRCINRYTISNSRFICMVTSPPTLNISHI